MCRSPTSTCSSRPSSRSPSRRALHLEDPENYPRERITAFTASLADSVRRLAAPQLLWYASDSLRTIATRAEEREPILPPREEAAELIPPRDGSPGGSPATRGSLAQSGYALLLQVTHPSVGAGVSQHSNFKEDPWGGCCGPSITRAP